MLTGLPHPLASGWVLASGDFQQEIEGKEDRDGVFFSLESSSTKLQFGMHPSLNSLFLPALST